MENKAKISDALPDSFATEEEAGEFWDMHSGRITSNFLKRQTVWQI